MQKSALCGAVVGATVLLAVFAMIAVSDLDLLILTLRILSSI